MGIMVGRMARDNPWEVARIEKDVFKRETFSREKLILDYAKYAEEQQETQNHKTSILVRPIINIFSGEMHSKKYRTILSEKAVKSEYSNKVGDLIREALEFMNQNNPDALKMTNGIRVKE